MKNALSHLYAIGLLHDLVTWYKKANGEMQNKGRSRWTGTSCFVLEVPLSTLHPSMCDFVLCDQIMQRAY